MGFKKLILASQSPRRREMITWLELAVNTASAHVDETPKDAEKAVVLATRLAQSKAHAIESNAKEMWILAADTIVDLNSAPLGKPQDAANARTLLQHLRQRSHAVHTGIALYNPANGKESVRHVTTQVDMRNYSDAEIETYIATGDPMDKAGAYAIQHQAFHPVAQLHWCYANVVGLPLCAVATLLEEWGLSTTVNIHDLCLEHFGYNCPRADKGIE